MKILQLNAKGKSSNTTSKGEHSADGDIVALSDWQDPEERLLQCWHCYHVWVDWLPRKFPLRRYPCDNCECVGQVTMGMNRREEE